MIKEWRKVIKNLKEVRNLLTHDLEFEKWASKRGSKLVGLATRRAAPFYKGLGYEESAVFFRKLLAD